MLNVFVKKSTEELYVQLSDGRIVLLEDLVRDYESLLKEEYSKEAITSELKVNEWFCIDREVINKSQAKIRCNCDEAGTEGKELWKRFKQSNKIADENPDQYPRLIETYIFKQHWDSETEQKMRDMCKDVGDGMCDEIICDLELQMRICNGEPVYNLVNKADNLPRVRVIKFRNGGFGYFGGSISFRDFSPPASLYRINFIPADKYYKIVPYVFRRVLS